MDAIEPILDYAVDLDFSRLPQEVVASTKAFILDTISLMIVGQKAPGCGELLELLTSWNGLPEATVIGTDKRLPSPYAAMMNGMSAHAFDFDDLHEGSDVHGYAVVLPALLATIQRTGRISGRSFIVALAVGVDVANRMGVAINRYRGWHATATCGIFGATIAAGLAAGLSRIELHNAVGIAYSLTSGTYQPILDSALSKRLQPGFAARAAVEAVQFAARGITGSKNVLEGRYGFYPLYEQGDYARSVLTDRLGIWFEGLATSMKPYPSCRFCHGVVDAMLSICEETDLLPHSVEAIVAKVPSEVHALVGEPYRPGQSPQVSAQFSIAFNISAATIWRRVGLREFERAITTDTKILEFSRRVSSIDNLDSNRFGPQEVTVTLRDGSVISRTVAVMKGHPDNAMTFDEVLTKARDCIIYAGKDPAIADKLAQWIADLDRQADVDGLFNLAAS